MNGPGGRGGLDVNDSVGLARGPQENLYSDGVDADPSAAVRATTAENRITFRQALEDSPGYRFRLKPDRRCSTQAYVGNDRRER